MSKTPLTWETKRARLKDLVEWELNPVQLTEKDAKHLAKSLDKFEHVLPYVAAEPYPGKNQRVPLLDGHQRKFVEININGVSPDTLVDVRFPSRKLTERERKEIVVRLRKNTGQFDFDKLANNFDVPDLLEWGFNEKELQLGGFDMTQETIDAEPQMEKGTELLKKWGVRRSDVWRIGDHRLVCGDCTDINIIDALLGNETINGLISDPPYSSGGATRGDRTLPTATKYQYNQDDIEARYQDFAGDNKDQRSWITWCHLWLSMFLQRAANKAVFALFIDWRQLPALTDAVQSAGWVWRGVAGWDKTEAARPLYGRFRPQIEFLVWGSAGPLPINDGSPSYAGVLRQAVVSNAKMHLTQKPIEAAEWSLSMVKEGGVVVDPFAGSGTTLLACANKGLIGRAMEISPLNCSIILERMATAFPDLKIERVKNGKKS